jgi:hypothetical protein
MSTRAEREAVTPATGAETSARLRRWAARRARQLLRITLALTFVLVCVVVGLLIWRAASLLGLPDIGDPFDLAAVGAAGVSDDQDAFVYFRRARTRLGRMPDPSREVARAGPVGRWSKVDPTLRR